MSNEVIVVILCSSLLIMGVMLLLLAHTERLGKTYQQANEDVLIRWDAEREAWQRERRELLDRIQAPTFGELKQAEVKLIKTQQGIREPEPLMPL